METTRASYDSGSRQAGLAFAALLVIVYGRRDYIPLDDFDVTSSDRTKRPRIRGLPFPEHFNWGNTPRAVVEKGSRQFMNSL